MYADIAVTLSTDCRGFFTVFYCDYPRNLWTFLLRFYWELFESKSKLFRGWFVGWFVGRYVAVGAGFARPTTTPHHDPHHDTPHHLPPPPQPTSGTTTIINHKNLRTFARKISARSRKNLRMCVVVRGGGVGGQTPPLPHDKPNRMGAKNHALA
jgi:hypothetical protein